MIVRQFEQSDASSSCSIINACITSTSHLSSPARFFLLSNNVPADFYNEIKDDYALIAELYGQIVGVGALRDNKIHHLYVSPDYQGGGIGETLMLALEAEAEAQGIDIIEVESPAQSIEFYEHLGYQNQGASNRDIAHVTLELTKLTKKISKLAGV